jgi:hypothetical protein
MNIRATFGLALLLVTLAAAAVDRGIDRDRSVGTSSSSGHDTLRVSGGDFAQLMRDDVFASWNGGDPAAVQRPGGKVLFFGEGNGCPVGGVRGGPVDIGKDDDQRLRPFTGLAAGPEGKRREWQPSGHTPACNAQAQARHGDSFVAVNGSDDNGGIALYTHTGPVNGRDSAFFGVLGDKGQGGSGNNKLIAGTFVGFRQPDSPAIHLWRNASDEAHIRTVQSVATIQLGDARSEPAQLVQHFTLALSNRQCHADAGHLCRMKYLFNLALYRGGITDWSRVGWFRNAKLMRDPAQSNMPILHGPVGASGEITHEHTSGIELWRSQGAPSQHDTFSQRAFDVRIPFADFVNGLKVIVANGRPPSSVTPAQIAAEFGPAWNDPQSWVLETVLAAQEIHNPSAAREAAIGGSVTAIEIGPGQ